MTTWLGILVGILAAAATMLLLRRDPTHRVLGLMLFGHAVNLAMFSMTGATRAVAPLVREGATAPPAPFQDPVPQALVLTAIVIGFALQAFALVVLALGPSTKEDAPT